MPGIIYHAMDRRKFIGTAALGAASVAITSHQIARADHHIGGSLHLSLLSDTHIPANVENEYRGFKPVANLDKIVPQVVAAKPTGVIINGDAARLTGEVRDYEQLKKQLAPIAKIAPIYVGLGNHDHRENFFSVIENIPGKRQAVAKKHVVAIEHPVARVLVLDSLLYVDKVAGLLGKAQRDWLSAYLATNDERPVVLFIHHTLGDGDGDLLDIDRVFKLIRKSGKVKAIFYGHSHQYSFAVRDNVHLINLPAVGYNFSDKEPVGWVDSSFRSNGVDLTLNAFAGNLGAHGKMKRLNWL